MRRVAYRRRPVLRARARLPATADTSPAALADAAETGTTGRAAAFGERRLRRALRLLQRRLSRLLAASGVRAHAEAVKDVR